MLKNWKLQNFKSYRNEQNIELAPITILAGANSSGKSTIIQSILLLKQTLQYGSQNRPLTLNGPLLRLGSFNDIRSIGSEAEPLRISFTYENEIEEADGIYPSVWQSSFKRRSLGSGDTGLRTIALDVTFGDGSEGAPTLPGTTSGASLAPAIESSKLVVTQHTDEDILQDRFAVLTGRDTADTSLPNLPFYLKVDPDSELEIFDGRPKASIVGGFPSHFLPSFSVVSFDAGAQRAKEQAEAIFSFHATALTIRRSARDALDQEIVGIVRRWLEQRGAHLPDDASTIGEIQQALLPFAPRRRGLLALGDLFSDKEQDSDLAALEREVTATMVESAESERTFDVSTPRLVNLASDFLRDYFQQGVRYLGPLRDSPRPVYQPEALESTTDVGYRGEHTAAVLDLNSNSTVQYFSPPSGGFENDYIAITRKKTASLHDAVVQWMAYLGVGE
ncbi:AAA family ATPase [Pelagibacterium luteolum]|uniref:AAA domain-containing protein n=1 Tax=Pelagibacterium luteolum TaxID=440168 RepID=A0A1G7V191_9HYPH|nr:AAA family ATPase [Pelagibacterium luteolum]SDG53526.1 AAA domain-containing protein [Pelagibacterium luteolum]